MHSMLLLHKAVIVAHLHDSDLYYYSFGTLVDAVIIIVVGVNTIFTDSVVEATSVASDRIDTLSMFYAVGV